MRNFLLCIIVLTCAVLLGAGSSLAQDPAWGRLRVATKALPVRENPDAKSTTVRTLKAGQLVRVDFEANGWVAVFSHTENKRAESKAWGYVPLNQLRLAGALDLPRPTPSSARAPMQPMEVTKELSKAAEGHQGEEQPKAELPHKRDAAVKAASKTVAEPKAESDAVAAPADSTKPAEKAKSADKAKVAENPVVKAKPTPVAKPAPSPKPFGEIRVPDRDLAIRAKRTKESEFVTLLRPGQRVRVDFQEDGFYAVFAPDEKVRSLSTALGYSRDKYLLTEKEYALVSKESPAGKAAPKAADKASDQDVDTAVEKLAEKAVAPEKAKAPGKAKEKSPADKPALAPPPAKLPPKTPLKTPDRPAPISAPPHASVQTPAHSSANSTAPAPAPTASKQPAPESADVVTYTVLSRRSDPLRPLVAPIVRVRLESAPPVGEALRRVVREIWKAERRKGEDMQLEVYLTGTEAVSLAYAVARFTEDGRLREFWWRESLLPAKN